METLLKELFELATAWKKFSHKKFGWETKDYKGVRCYFAEARDHTAVDIGEISIGFHNRPKIEAPLDAMNETHLRELIDKYRIELHNEETAFENEEAQEKIERKKDRIENLKKQLEEAEKELN